MSKKQSQSKISTTTITLAVIASFIVSFAIYFLLMWAAGMAESDVPSGGTETSEVAGIVILLLFIAFMLLSPVVAAVIIWFKIRKNKK